MIENIYLSDVVDREAPATKQVSLSVVGDVVYIRIEETEDTAKGRVATIIQRKLSEEEKEAHKKAGTLPLPVRALCSVDLGDLVEAVALLAASSERLKARVMVETKQKLERSTSIEVELAQTTVREATRKFDELYTKFEANRVALDMTSKALKEVEIQLRGARWKLAQEMHRQGHGPDPGPMPNEPVEEEEVAEDAADAPA